MIARPHFVLLSALALSIASACARGPEVTPARPAVAAPGRLTSNVTRADYAGTEACRPCHASHVERWLGSAMHAMTRDVAKAQIHAPFDGATFAFKGDRVVLRQSGGAKYMQIASVRYGEATYRVTRVIGGRHREDFAGVKVASAELGAKVLSAEEEVLPVSWLIGPRRFRYKGYSVMLKERPGLRAGPVWNRTCIFCHNTAPYLLTTLRPIAPEAGPYQGQVVDATLPEARRAHVVVTDQAAFERALGRELDALGAGADPTPADRAVRTIRTKLRAEHLVEVGIGCESCHLGSKAHVQDPRVAPSLEPRAPFMRVDLPGAPAEGSAEHRAALVNRACARCHQVLFSGYPHTWEGGARRGPSPGGSNINSGEARDLLLGACASKLSCVDCHDPHSPDRGARLRAGGEAQVGATCVRCHTQLSTDAARRAHTHHDPRGEGGQCVSCHMPKKNMGLDGQLTRYHRVGSPTEPARVYGDRPLECALCHADRSTESLVTTMESWWGKRYDRRRLAKLYGDLDVSPLVATLTKGKPHELAVAYAVLGRARASGHEREIALGLTHELPIIRGYAAHALEEILGASSPVDVDADADEIERAAKAWLSSSRPPP
ncbi:MAG: cytochrome c3 family protein [Polyangiaceae bacterium]